MARNAPCDEEDQDFESQENRLLSPSVEIWAFNESCGTAIAHI
jgi:hypothetical protein